MPSKELLNKYFRYDDKTGDVYNRISRRRAKARTKLNSHIHRGYPRTKIFGKRFDVHQIVWALHNGVAPAGFQIHHIDRNKTNHRIENLRLVTAAGNLELRGVLGVIRAPGVKSWECRGAESTSFHDSFETAVATFEAEQKKRPSD